MHLRAVVAMEGELHLEGLPSSHDAPLFGTPGTKRSQTRRGGYPLPCNGSSVRTGGSEFLLCSLVASQVSAAASAAEGAGTVRSVSPATGLVRQLWTVHGCEARERRYSWPPSAMVLGRLCLPSVDNRKYRLLTRW